MQDSIPGVSAVSRRSLLAMATFSLWPLAGCGGGGGGGTAAASAPVATPSPATPVTPVTPVTPAPSVPVAILKPKGLFASSPSSGIYGHAQLRGVLVRSSWSVVEPTPGRFDFSALALQVAEVKAAGKPWSLAISAGAAGSPAWLMDTLGARFINVTFRGDPARLALFWDTVVQERLRQLVNRLALEFGQDASLQLVYVPQMTANGIEGHLQGVDMATFAQAGYTDDVWVEAAKQTARHCAQAFLGKALAFEVHDVNNGATVPTRIIQDLWNDSTLQQRVGAAIWWLSGRTDYQPALLDVLRNFPGDIYGQVIGRSDQSDRFGSNDYRTVFSQAQELGVRYVEPWAYEFGTGPVSAAGVWDATLASFNTWAASTFA